MIDGLIASFVANFVVNLHFGCRAFILTDATLSAPLMLQACRELRPDILNTVPWVSDARMTRDALPTNAAIMCHIQRVAALCR